MKVKEESRKVGLKLNIQKTKIMASGPIISRQIDGETMETMRVFGGTPKSLQMVNAAMKLKDACSLEEKLWPTFSAYWKAETLPTNVHQSYGISSSHVWMWELDYKETWALKNWCFWTVVLEKTPENPLDCKEIQPVHPKGNQSWIFLVRTDAKAETPRLWPPDETNRLTGKDPDAGKDWRPEEKGTAENEMVRWPHQCNGHEFE